MKGLTAESVAADGLDIGLDDGLDDGVIKAGFDLDNGFGAEQCFVESNYGLVALWGLYSGFRALGFELCFRAFLSFVFEFFSKSAFQALWFASDGAAVDVLIKRSGQYCVLLA
ncbi:MAG: hypothetical protein HQ497_06180, partial [SAR86 cluster bacterium]|nr:hypothetical protein [SAR86 cluster bacterium]